MGEVDHKGRTWTEAPVEDKGFWDDAEIISVYTRREAVEDGVQYDGNIEPFGEVTREHFKYPVYMSSAVYWKIKSSADSKETWTDYEGIWHDILWKALMTHREISPSQWEWITLIRNAENKEEKVKFYSEVGPLDFDDPAPCVYIRLAGECD